MPALTLPATVKALANTIVVVLTTPPAAGTGIPTATEVNAGKFITCFLYGDQSTLFPPTQNTGQGQRKACTKVSPTALGTVTYPAQQLEYSWGPQAAAVAGNAANVALESLAPGSTVTLVQLSGLPGLNSTVSAGQVMTGVYKVDCGVQTATSTGQSEYDDFSTKQELVLSAAAGGVPIATNVALT